MKLMLNSTDFILITSSGLRSYGSPFFLHPSAFILSFPPSPLIVYHLVVKRERVDRLLVERGLAPTRTRAQALVMAGLVLVGEQRVGKPSETYPPDVPL